MALTPAERETLQLIHDGQTWHLSAGRYRASWPACSCSRRVCTCKRRGVQHVLNACHGGHADHAAILLRRLIWGR